jgi:predicted RNase H-like HicB family nuclease
MLERAEGEYLAWCEELRAVASGATEQEALANLKEAVRVLIAEYGGSPGTVKDGPATMEVW